MEKKSESSMMNSYGLNDTMLTGITKKRDGLSYAHPLELSEKNYERNRHRGEMDMLRKMQGRASALKIEMERAATSKVGHLPGVITSRSNFAFDAVRGADDFITFNDIFGKPEDFERGLALPHLQIEKQLGIL